MRSLAQLKSSTDILSGAESQRLRTFCTSEYLNIDTGLSDHLGSLLKDNDLAGLKYLFSSRPSAKDDFFNKRWGPTEIPIYNVILTMMVLDPSSRSSRLEMVRWLVHEAKIGTDGTDLSGTSALMHSISTKPYLDIDFAALMLEGGADINRRNRYGCTTASEIVMVWPGQSEDRAVVALQWFMNRGGNVEIKDGDGVSAKAMVMSHPRRVPGLAGVVSGKPAEGSKGTGALGKKVGRNEPCTCGSGKKFKFCCGKA